jgi:serine/threonine protein phosphatase PrpC
LEPTDEFLILGCDGIWDCLTNEKAVEYVLARINDRTPVQIGLEMLDEIISVDPRVTQGIGGDNMTIMIIDLKPHARSYRRAAEASPVED